MADKDLKALFLHQLKDTYFAENAILKALPQMAEAAQAEELKGAFAVHLKETEGQVKRLEQVFQLVGESLRVLSAKPFKASLRKARRSCRSSAAARLWMLG
jgi:ferritin-like metal-binding protein YciE